MNIYPGFFSENEWWFLRLSLSLESIENAKFWWVQAFYTQRLDKNNLARTKMFWILNCFLSTAKGDVAASIKWQTVKSWSSNWWWWFWLARGKNHDSPSDLETAVQSSKATNGLSAKFCQSAISRFWWQFSKQIVHTTLTASSMAWSRWRSPTAMFWEKWFQQ